MGKRPYSLWPEKKAEVETSKEHESAPKEEEPGPKPKGNDWSYAPDKAYFSFNRKSDTQRRRMPGLRPKRPHRRHRPKGLESPKGMKEFGPREIQPRKTVRPRPRRRPALAPVPARGSPKCCQQQKRTTTRTRTRRRRKRADSRNERAWRIRRRPRAKPEVHGVQGARGEESQGHRREGQAHGQGGQERQEGAQGP